MPTIIPQGLKTQVVKNYQETHAKHIQGRYNQVHLYNVTQGKENNSPIVHRTIFHKRTRKGWTQVFAEMRVGIDTTFSKIFSARKNLDPDVKGRADKIRAKRAYAFYEALGEDVFRAVFNIDKQMTNDDLKKFSLSKIEEAITKWNNLSSQEQNASINQYNQKKPENNKGIKEEKNNDIKKEKVNNAVKEKEISTWKSIKKTVKKAFKDTKEIAKEVIQQKFDLSPEDIFKQNIKAISTAKKLSGKSIQTTAQSPVHLKEDLKAIEDMYEMNKLHTKEGGDAHGNLTLRVFQATPQEGTKEEKARANYYIECDFSRRSGTQKDEKTFREERRESFENFFKRRLKLDAHQKTLPNTTALMKAIFGENYETYDCSQNDHSTGDVPYFSEKWIEAKLNAWNGLARHAQLTKIAEATPKAVVPEGEKPEPEELVIEADVPAAKDGSVNDDDVDDANKNKKEKTSFIKLNLRKNKKQKKHLNNFDNKIPKGKEISNISNSPKVLEEKNDPASISTPPFNPVHDEVIALYLHDHYQNNSTNQEKNIPIKEKGQLLQDYLTTYAVAFKIAKNNQTEPEKKIAVDAFLSRSRQEINTILKGKEYEEIKDNAVEIYKDLKKKEIKELFVDKSKLGGLIAGAKKTGKKASEDHQKNQRALYKEDRLILQLLFQIQAKSISAGNDHFKDLIAGYETASSKDNKQGQIKFSKNEVTTFMTSEAYKNFKTQVQKKVDEALGENNATPEKRVQFLKGMTSSGKFKRTLEGTHENSYKTTKDALKEALKEESADNTEIRTKLQTIIESINLGQILRTEGKKSPQKILAQLIDRMATKKVAVEQNENETDQKYLKRIVNKHKFPLDQKALQNLEEHINEILKNQKNPLFNKAIRVSIANEEDINEISTEFYTHMKSEVQKARADTQKRQRLYNDNQRLILRLLCQLQKDSITDGNKLYGEIKTRLQAGTDKGEKDSLDTFIETQIKEKFRDSYGKFVKTIMENAKVSSNDGLTQEHNAEDLEKLKKHLQTLTRSGKVERNIFGPAVINPAKEEKQALEANFTKDNELINLMNQLREKKNERTVKKGQEVQLTSLEKSLKTVEERLVARFLQERNRSEKAWDEKTPLIQYAQQFGLDQLGLGVLLKAVGNLSTQYQKKQGEVQKNPDKKIKASSQTIYDGLKIAYEEGQKDTRARNKINERALFFIWKKTTQKKKTGFLSGFKNRKNAQEKAFQNFISQSDNQEKIQELIKNEVFNNFMTKTLKLKLENPQVSLATIRKLKFESIQNIPNTLISDWKDTSELQQNIKAIALEKIWDASKVKGEKKTFKDFFSTLSEANKEEEIENFYAQPAFKTFLTTNLSLEEGWEDLSSGELGKKLDTLKKSENKPASQDLITAMTAWKSGTPPPKPNDLSDGAQELKPQFLNDLKGIDLDSFSFSEEDRKPTKTAKQPKQPNNQNSQTTRTVKQPEQPNNQNSQTAKEENQRTKITRTENKGREKTTIVKKNK